MGTAIVVSGYFSPGGEKPQLRNIHLSFDSYGLREHLTLDCQGAYRITIPYRPVEQLAARARQALRQQSGTVEPSVQVEAHDEHLLSGRATVWLRANADFFMLTVELGRRGQISAPYRQIEQLVRRERSTLA